MYISASPYFSCYQALHNRITFSFMYKPLIIEKKSLE